MKTPNGAAAAKAVSAIDQLRAAEKPFRLVPVPCNAIPGWNRLISDWAVA